MLYSNNHTHMRQKMKWKEKSIVRMLLNCKYWQQIIAKLFELF